MKDYIILKLSEVTVFLLFFGLFPLSGQAEPFCISSQSLPLQCLYTDVKVCIYEANKIKAQCKVNPDEITLEDSLGRFCMVRSYGTPDCIYSDLSSCNKNVQNQDSICQDSRMVPDFTEANIPAQAESQFQGDTETQSWTREVSEDQFYKPSFPDDSIHLYPEIDDLDATPQQDLDLE